MTRTDPLDNPEEAPPRLVAFLDALDAKKKAMPWWKRWLLDAWLTLCG